MRLGYLPQPREQRSDRGAALGRACANCAFTHRCSRNLTPALGALVQVHDRVIVGVAAELTVDEHADQVAEVSHDVASPGIRRTVRAGRGVLIRGRRLRSGARCSSAARN